MYYWVRNGSFPVGNHRTEMPALPLPGCAYNHGRAAEAHCASAPRKQETHPKARQSLQRALCFVSTLTCATVQWDAAQHRNMSSRLCCSSEWDEWAAKWCRGMWSIWSKILDYGLHKLDHSLASRERCQQGLRGHSFKSREAILPRRTIILVLHWDHSMHS